MVVAAAVVGVAVMTRIGIGSSIGFLMGERGLLQHKYMTVCM